MVKPNEIKESMGYEWQASETWLEIKNGLMEMSFSREGLQTFIAECLEWLGETAPSGKKDFCSFCYRVAQKLKQHDRFTIDERIQIESHVREEHPELSVKIER